MLGQSNAIATVAVKNLDAAKRFYEQTLGLQPEESQEAGAQTYQTGNSSMLVYESQYAGSNRATTVTWSPKDGVEKTVASLKGKGVVFEHYDNLPGMTSHGDFYSAGSHNVAWFKDPDGNIHALVGR